MTRPSKPLIDTLGEYSEPNPETGCWDWLGNKNSLGYGLVSRAGSSTTAHRAMYDLYYGPIANDMKVLHECDNPGCVNPRHLRLGTQADNMQEMVEKGRMSNHQRGMLKKSERIARVQAVRAGMPNSEIAVKFGVKERTIQRWRQNIARQEGLEDGDVAIACPVNNVYHSIHYQTLMNGRRRKR